LESQVEGISLFDIKSGNNADHQKLQAVSMDHRRIKKFALTRWLRASALATQAKQAKALADRHLVGRFPPIPILPEQR
jgi:pimeloyl-CoA synthetase